jgi:hypothetical protein
VSTNVATITVGNLAVTLRPQGLRGLAPLPAMISCGTINADVSPAAGKRFFDELTKIREALVAAHEVLTQRMRSGHAATPAEVRLASRLVELEVLPDWENTIGKLVHGDGEKP